MRHRCRLDHAGLFAARCGGARFSLCHLHDLREPIGRGEVSYLVLLQPEPEGGFTVTCPALPGLVSYGASLDEARAMAADAIVGYIECLREDGEPVPPTDEPCRHKLGIACDGRYDQVGPRDRSP